MRGWTVLTRITSKTEGARPVYLLSAQRLPQVPKTAAELGFGGSYLMGEGSYDVNWLLVDDRERVCRKSWHVEVRRSRGERAVTVAMPRDTVWDVSLRGARLLPKNTDDAAPLRLTILLNVAPLYQRRMRMRGGDIGTLISAVSSLLERVPTREVRLVAFNLEQQRELYRNADFHIANMPEVAQAMYGVELGTVDFNVLKNRRGHVDLLAGLLNQELNQEPPADVVLLMGPVSRYYDRVPAELLKAPAAASPRFLSVQISPAVQEPEASLPDLIRNAISRLGGKNVRVHSPGEFARAIATLEKTENKR